MGVVSDNPIGERHPIRIADIEWEDFAGPDEPDREPGPKASDGEALLAELFAHCTKDRYVYEHHWTVGESVFWLNTQTMHQREAFPPDQVRELRHVNILGHTDPRQLATISKG